MGQLDWQRLDGVMAEAIATLNAAFDAGDPDAPQRYLQYREQQYTQHNWLCVGWFDWAILIPMLAREGWTWPYLHWPHAYLEEHERWLPYADMLARAWAILGTHEGPVPGDEPTDPQLCAERIGRLFMFAGQTKVWVFPDEREWFFQVSEADASALRTALVEVRDVLAKTEPLFDVVDFKGRLHDDARWLTMRYTMEEMIAVCARGAFGMYGS